MKRIVPLALIVLVLAGCGLADWPKRSVPGEHLISVPIYSVSDYDCNARIDIVADDTWSFTDDGYHVTKPGVGQMDGDCYAPEYLLKRWPDTPHQPVPLLEKISSFKTCGSIYEQEIFGLPGAVCEIVDDSGERTGINAMVILNDQAVVLAADAYRGITDEDYAELLTLVTTWEVTEY